MTSSQLQTWCGSVPWHYRANGHGPRGLFVLGSPPVSLTPLSDGTRRVVAAPLPPVDSVLEVTDGLVGLLDREGLARVDLFGHAAGAAVAHAFVRRHPDRVDRLALSAFGLLSEGKARWVRLFDRWGRRLPGGGGPAQRALLADLFRNRGGYRVDEPQLRPGRVLLVHEARDLAFTRREHEALAHTYPGAIITYACGHQLDHKLELFFRAEPLRPALPALPRSA